MADCILNNKTLEEWKNETIILQNINNQLERKLNQYIPLYYRYLQIFLHRGSFFQQIVHFCLYFQTLNSESGINANEILCGRYA